MGIRGYVSFRESGLFIFFVYDVSLLMFWVFAIVHDIMRDKIGLRLANSPEFFDSLCIPILDFGGFLSNLHKTW